MTFPEALRAAIARASRQELTEILACVFSEPLRKQLAAQELDSRNRLAEMGRRARQREKEKCLHI
jgi:hypothetical protein